MSQAQQEEICRMFDRIARTYDPLNRLLSCGLDQTWRSRMVAQMPKACQLHVLDIACGTADVAIALAKLDPRAKIIKGIDLSANMINIGKQKIHKLGLGNKIELQVADACALPFDDNNFHVLTNAFGIRNITFLDKALEEMLRVLKPGGRAIILEFSLPTNSIVKLGYLLYFRHVLPFVGGLISRDAQAYRYLNRTVESFLKPKDFSGRLLKAGFKQVSMSSLSCGIATLYSAEKH